ncbi:hypothetical protein H9P43_004907 [Blastocladiella emersonii ATCC 22665]|nr:hypothetical protein H9P43_004907 [Blastocladiella emersonii ATCC 22665]
MILRFLAMAAVAAIAVLAAAVPANALVTDSALVYLPAAGRAYAFGGVPLNSSAPTSANYTIDPGNTSDTQALASAAITKVVHLPRPDRLVVPLAVGTEIYLLGGLADGGAGANLTWTVVTGLGSSSPPSNATVGVKSLPAPTRMIGNFSAAARQAGIFAAPGRESVAATFFVTGSPLQNGTAGLRAHAALVAVNQCTAVVTGGVAASTGQPMADIYVVNMAGTSPTASLSVAIPDPRATAANRTVVVVLGGHDASLLEYFDPYTTTKPVAANATVPADGPAAGMTRHAMLALGDKIMARFLTVSTAGDGGLQFIWIPAKSAAEGAAAADRSGDADSGKKSGGMSGTTMLIIFASVIVVGVVAYGIIGWLGYGHLWFSHY